MGRRKRRRKVSEFAIDKMAKYKRVGETIQKYSANARLCLITMPYPRKKFRLPKQPKYCCKAMASLTFGTLPLLSTSQTWRGGFSGLGMIGDSLDQGAGAGPASRTGGSLGR